MINLKDAEKEGWDAFWRNRTEKSNPYFHAPNLPWWEREEKYQEWEDGWRLAEVFDDDYDWISSCSHEYLKQLNPTPHNINGKIQQTVNSHSYRTV